MAIDKGLMKMSFTFEQLSEPLLNAILDLNYKTPTDIQAQTIPLLLNETTDFVGQAQTGTGKTAAFCLPLLEKLDLQKKGIQALILTPTRELANQINDEIIKFSKYLPVHTATVYGGVGYDNQIEKLKKAHIVIATPGRAIDLLKRDKLKIGKTQYFIIDEADEMLKMGFIEDVEMIIENIPQESQKWMFSATMPDPIVRLMKEKLNEPRFVRIEKRNISHSAITHSYCCLPKKDFIKALKAVLMMESDFYGIVFCETKEETKLLGDKLQGFGKKAVALHGDLSQKQRDVAVAQFKAQKADILVCTDVGARGLDVANVTHVINMGLPRKYDSYIHRVGRTGRAGKSGKAITFVAPSERRGLQLFEKLSNQKMEVFSPPNPVKIKAEKINAELEKMQSLKTALIDKKELFKVDDSFKFFEEYFSTLSKDEVIKLVFSYYFNSELRLIDESFENFKNSALAKLPSPSRERTQKGSDKGFSRSRSKPDDNKKSRSSSGRSFDKKKSYSNDDRSDRYSSSSKNQGNQGASKTKFKKAKSNTSSNRTATKSS